MAVSVYALLGLSSCESCAAPLCRECGGHPHRVDRVQPGWSVGGWRCECGWALADMEEDDGA